jgi:proline dehydrogenase
MRALQDTSRPALQPVRRLVLAQATPSSRSVLASPRTRSPLNGSLTDALQAVSQQATSQVLSTLGHRASPTDSPRCAADACLAGIDALAGVDQSAVMSLRLGALGFDTDLLDKVLLRAREQGLAVQFDSQGPDGAGATIASVQRGLALHDDLGITLPGRWMRSRADADLAVDLGLRVRVVKGLWADPMCPQFDERAGFLAVVARLAGKARFVSVATHDAAVARVALKRLRDAGTPCELELNHGVPQQAVLQVARSLGVSVRNYIAYGAGSASCVSQGQAPAYWRAGRDVAVTGLAGG